MTEGGAWSTTGPLQPRLPEPWCPCLTKKLSESHFLGWRLQRSWGLSDSRGQRRAGNLRAGEGDHEATTFTRPVALLTSPGMKRFTSFSQGIRCHVLPGRLAGRSLYLVGSGAQFLPVVMDNLGPTFPIANGGHHVLNSSQAGTMRMNDAGLCHIHERAERRRDHRRSC